MTDTIGPRERAESALRGLRSHDVEVVLHGGRTLGEHLRGTHQVLLGWSQPDRICLAGAVHSVYSTDTFRHSVLPLDKRGYLRDLIGDEAEWLVFLFCSTNRREILSALQRGDLEQANALRVADRRTGSALSLSVRDIGDLAVLHMANLAEQSGVGSTLPSAWLAQIATWARWARRFAEVPPSVLDGCSANVDVDTERKLLEVYAGAFTDANHQARSTAMLAAAALELPWVGEPLIMLALAKASDGDLLVAAELVGHGEALLDEWGVAWDKRLSTDEWKYLCGIVRGLCAARGRRADALMANFREAWADAAGSPARLLGNLMGAHSPARAESLAAVGTPDGRLDDGTANVLLPGRFVQFLSQLAGDPRPNMRMYPRLESEAWYEPQGFALVHDLEAAAPQILKEALRLESRRFQDEAEAIPRSGTWSVLFLYERGRRVDEHCALCPITTQIVERHRTHRSLGGIIYFSNLAPGTYVSPHRGPTNMRLRVHLGLDIPPNCGLRVDDQILKWQPGRCTVFNDVFVHEVWNWGDHRRLVLVVDLWHPDMTDREVQLVDGLYRYAIEQGANMRSYWNRNQAARAAMVERP